MSHVEEIKEAVDTAIDTTVPAILAKVADEVRAEDEDQAIAVQTEDRLH